MIKQRFLPILCKSNLIVYIKNILHQPSKHTTLFWRPSGVCNVQNMGALNNSHHFSIWHAKDFLVNANRYLDVDSTFFERYGRQMDVKTTLCLSSFFNIQDDVLTSIQHFFEHYGSQMDVKTTFRATASWLTL